MAEVHMQRCAGTPVDGRAGGERPCRRELPEHACQGHQLQSTAQDPSTVVYFPMTVLHIGRKRPGGALSNDE